jgi:tRNA 5-methylaminomethyl-2-thiouridine biosynthesis bifunctional protein
MRKQAGPIMQSEPWYTTPKPLYNNKHAIIIGGGLSGTSAAYSLSRRGWKVTLIERNNGVGQEASGNLVGIVNSLLSHKNDLIGEFYLAGFNYTLKYIEALKQSGCDISFNQCGVLELGERKASKDVESMTSDTQIRKLSAAEAGEICGERLHSGGLFNPNAGWVNPSELCNTAISNASYVFSTNALSLHKINGNWSVKDNSGSEISCAPVVIVANANDAKSFAQCHWLPIEPVRGQITYLPNSEIKTKAILCYEGGYITPEIGGTCYVGATFNRSARNLDVSIDEHKENLSNLKNHLQIKDHDYSQLQGRAAFRATSPDRRPIVGAVPDYVAFRSDYADLRHGRLKTKYPVGKYLEGLYVSTGHGSRGLTGCPISGELLAAQINNETTPLPQNIVNALSPARFIIRDLKRNTL